VNIVHFQEGPQVKLLDSVTVLPETGFIWLECIREANEDANWLEVVEQLTGYRIHERHVADSLNQAHPSFYDQTSEYDMLVFRGISSTTETHELVTRPTVFFLFDRLLVTIRDADSVSIPTVLERMLKQTGRIPKRPAGLMHAVLAKMVDRFLMLREPLLEQLDTWRRDLLDPNNPFDDWMAVMQNTSYLRRLVMLCDEQHNAVIAWRENTNVEFDDHLAVRYTDLIEHIERVMKFATEQKGEVDALVQMHFSAVAHRTNEIVRVLTVISAIFLPLTLVAGIFGMNFEYMPELKLHNAYFIALAGMLGAAVGMLLLFKKKRWI
jgi:magnesium/cobalt transport protein CorA